MSKIKLLEFENISYRESLSIQEDLQKKIILNDSDDMFLLFVNYNEHIFTFGKYGNKENLLIDKDIIEKLNIKIFESDRGGDITYHGPGQLVVYPIFNLKKLNLRVKKFVRKIELVIKSFLKELKIESEILEKKPGLWVGNKKIASIGFNIKRHITKHGFSLNLSNDLSYYKYINTCGFEGLELTSIKNEINRSISTQFCYERLNFYIESFFETSTEKCVSNEVVDSQLIKVL